MTALYIALGIIFFLAAVYLFLIFPATPKKGERAKFENRYFAHRGYFTNDGPYPPENTLEGFDRACLCGFGSELDVQFTSDGHLIVFHDNDYKRACGIDKKVWEVPLDEARSYKLFGRDYKVPLFSEMLDCVAGRAPLIIEIKAEERTNADYYELCSRVEQALRGYKGEYCIESFNPFVIRWWRLNRPQVVRGQLLNGASGYPKSIPAVLRFALANLLLGFMGRPNFIAYDWRTRPHSVGLNRALGGMSVLWTVKDAQSAKRLEAHNDAIIFDSYIQDSTTFSRKENKNGF